MGDMVGNPKNQPEPSWETPALNLGVIGGGKRCLMLVHMIESGELAHLPARIVGVADLNPQAEGLVYAKARGIFTTQVPCELLALDDLDRIIELTGQPELLDELAEETSRLVDPLLSQVFADLVAVRLRLRQKEEECSLTGALARTLSAATEEGVMVLDANYLILSANQAALRMAGLNEQEALGRYCFQVSHQSLGPCDSPEHPCPMRQTLATGLPAHAIHRHLDAQGQGHYCEISTYPVRDDQGRVMEVLEIFRDITSDLDAQVEHRTKAIKEDLSRLVQEDKLVSLGKLVASVAHEINNPIASIFNFSKLIHKSMADHAPTEQERTLFQRWLELTVREASRCGAIVSNLLGFARQQSLEPRRFDLKELLETIIALVRHRMELSEVDLALDLPAGELVIWGDYAQIQQCITNLVFNALEAMPQGGRLAISADVPAGQEQVRLSVADNGQGIAPEVLPFIFEPFFTTKSQVQGVGLGLSMVYGIMREHGGRITVQSQPGQGATFDLWLPTSPPPTPAIPPGESQ